MIFLFTITIFQFDKTSLSSLGTSISFASVNSFSNFNEDPLDLLFFLIFREFNLFFCVLNKILICEIFIPSRCIFFHVVQIHQNNV